MKLKCPNCHHVYGEPVTYQKAATEAQRRSSEKFLATFDDMYKQGMTVDQIAEALGVQPVSIKRRLKRLGYAVGKVYRDETEAQVEQRKEEFRKQFYSLIDQGFPFDAIADELGYASRRGLMDKLKKVGVDTTPYRIRKGPSSQFKRRFIELHGEGLSFHEIRKAMGYDYYNFMDRTLKLGLRVKQTGGVKNSDVILTLP